MQDVAPGGDVDARQLNELARLFDAPAYVRRARAVQDAMESMLERCRVRRDGWLLMPRIRLGTLRAQAGSYETLTPWLAGPAEVAVLESLEARIVPQPRARVGRTDSPRVLRRGLARLVESLANFNARWSAFIGGLDLGPVAELRKQYNLYYVLEKSCSLRSDLLARQGFVPVPPPTVAEVLGHLPPLVVPALRK